MHVSHYVSIYVVLHVRLLFIGLSTNIAVVKTIRIFTEHCQYFHLKFIIIPTTDYHLFLHVSYNLFPHIPCSQVVT